MRQLLAMERRLQDLEIGSRNSGRTGKVTDVKFDKELGGWYARMEQGEGANVFKTDWLPWKSFSHGTIKISIPPKKGQLVELSSPQGQAEQGWLQPHHYDPDNSAPHDKEDEIFLRVQQPTENGQEPSADKKLDVLVKEGQLKITTGKTTHDLTKDSVTTETEKQSLTNKTSSERTNQHTLEAKNRTVKSQNTTVQSTNYKLGGKVLINC